MIQQALKSEESIMKKEKKVQEKPVLYYNDPSFLKFVKRYGLDAEDPNSLLEYRMWLPNQIMERQELETLKAQAEAKAMAEGIAKGRAIGFELGYAKSYAKSYAESYAEGLAEGRAIGIAEVNKEIATNAFNSEESEANWPETERLLKLGDIPQDIIEDAKSQKPSQSQTIPNTKPEIRQAALIRTQWVFPAAVSKPQYFPRTSR
jgi:flagellar biosynthesis/type III secretory pathway protein FliH